MGEEERTAEIHAGRQCDAVSVTAVSKTLGGKFTGSMAWHGVPAASTKVSAMGQFIAQPCLGLPYQ
jgi:hypothetical protein